MRFQLVTTWHNCTSSLTALFASLACRLPKAPLPCSPSHHANPANCPSPSRDGINSTFLPKEDFSNLPKFEKNFYYEHPAVTARTDDDVRLGWQRRHVAAIPCSDACAGWLPRLAACPAPAACRCSPPVRSALLTAPPLLLSIAGEQVRRYREQRDIHVTGEGVPKPVSNFEEASFPGEALDALRAPSGRRHLRGLVCGWVVWGHVGRQLLSS